MWLTQASWLDRRTEAFIKPKEGEKADSGEHTRNWNNGGLWGNLHDSLHSLVKGADGALKQGDEVECRKWGQSRPVGKTLYKGQGL